MPNHHAIPRADKACSVSDKSRRDPDDIWVVQRLILTSHLKVLSKQPTATLLGKNLSKIRIGVHPRKSHAQDLLPSRLHRSSRSSDLRCRRKSCLRSHARQKTGMHHPTSSDRRLDYAGSANSLLMHHALVFLTACVLQDYTATLDGLFVVPPVNTTNNGTALFTFKEARIILPLVMLISKHPHLNKAIE